MEIPASFFNVSFSKAMAFGYKTEDVDDFVTQALQHIRDLQEENTTLLRKMSVLAESLEKYREEEDSLRSALVGAQKLGDSILRDCRGKAEAILRDATTRADKVTQDAALELERTQYELAHLRTETTEFKEKLFSLYRTHLDHINHIPANREVAERHQKTPPPPAPAAAAPEPEPQAEEPYEPEYSQHSYDDAYDDSPEADTAPQQPEDSYQQPYADEDNTDYGQQPAYEDAEQPDTDDYDFPDEPASDDDFDNEPIGNYSEVEYTEEIIIERHAPEPVPMVTAVAEQEEDGTTAYVPRGRATEHGGRRGKATSIFEPLPMVQMEFFEQTEETEDEDEFFADSKDLRSVDLNRIPYFDDEDEEDDDVGGQSPHGKHRVSKKFGELKFGDSFNLTDD